MELAAARKCRLVPRILAVAPALCIGMPHMEGWPASPFGIAAAHADDDDGDDDGGGGGRGGGYSGDRSGGGGDSMMRRGGSTTPRQLFRDIRRAITGRAAPRRSRAAAPAAPLPERADNEIVALGISGEQRQQLVADGYEVVDEASISMLDTAVLKLRIPDGVTLEAARDAVRAIAANAEIDFNHFYRPEEDDEACSGPHCVAPQMIGWPVRGTAAEACSGEFLIGLIDTGINPDHDAFTGGRLEALKLGAVEADESGLQHGTAVAALLVGSPESRTPGLLPGAAVVAIDAFHRAARNDDRTDAFTLVRAIDMAMERQVTVLNMSLAGPPNELLHRTITESAREAVLVAAVGNGGPQAEPAYPAAYEGVLGVTAVDRRMRAYRRAGRGEHVDLAAPGVEVWTAASISGARAKTGTSFAAPFVTAAAAVMSAAKPDLSPAEIKERLKNQARDLGDPGHDPVYGWGLLDASTLCAGEETAPRPAVSTEP